MTKRFHPRYFRLLLFVAATLFAGAWQARAGDVVELLTNMDYPPYIDDTLPGGGLHTEIIQAAFTAAGAELKIRVMPWKRITRELEEGRATGSFTWALTPERRENFIVSAPVFYSEAIFFTRLDDFTGAADIQTRADQGKQTVLCKPLGWTMPSFALPLLESGALQVVQPPRLRFCFELMLAGRADFVDVPTLSAWYALQAIMGEATDPEAVRVRIKVVHDPDAEGGTSHVLFVKSPNGKRANALFAKGMQLIGQNGTLRAIVDRHLQPYPHANKEALIAGLRRAGVLLDRDTAN
ncbi:MAG: transporter substrate-binding domain-containing protein [Alphaproteobacteria bacterium]|nr:transporter substrate-binding domain-containing protein [Alphaproteobacteria bacterium]